MRRGSRGHDDCVAIYGFHAASAPREPFDWKGRGILHQSCTEAPHLHFRRRKQSLAAGRSFPVASIAFHQPRCASPLLQLSISSCFTHLSNPPYAHTTRRPATATLLSTITAHIPQSAASPHTLPPRSIMSTIVPEGKLLPRLPFATLLAPHLPTIQRPSREPISIARRPRLLTRF